MVCYFNKGLFKVAYSMLRFFTVALLIAYCLLAFNVSLFSILFFQMLDFYVEIFMFFILDNSLLYVTPIRDSFPLFSPKKFLYQLVRLVTNS